MTTDPNGSDEAEDLRAVSRAAAVALDERPSAAVRVTVLAAAARAAGAKPRDAALPIVARGRRWPMSVAAVLVVSVIAGLVVTRTSPESPDRSAAAPPGSDAAVTVAQADVAAAAPAEQAAPPAVALPQGVPAAKQAPAQRAARTSPETRSSPRPPPADRPAGPAFRPEPPSAVAPAPSASGDASDALADTRSETAPARARAAAPRVTLGDRAAAKELAPGLTSELTPQAWIERVVALRRAGRSEDADRELDALRRRYPEFAIPADALAPTGTR